MTTVPFEISSVKWKFEQHTEFSIETTLGGSNEQSACLLSRAEIERVKNSRLEVLNKMTSNLEWEHVWLAPPG